MNRQFAVSADLQQYLQASGSRALTNVIWNATFTVDAPLLPLSPAAVRRSISYTKLSFSPDATPVEEYNCFIANLDGGSVHPITLSRRL